MTLQTKRREIPQLAVDCRALTTAETNQAAKESLAFCF